MSILKVWTRLIVDVREKAEGRVQAECVQETEPGHEKRRGRENMTGAPDQEEQLGPRGQDIRVPKMAGLCRDQARGREVKPSPWG